jgi:hypothetical protein
MSDGQRCVAGGIALELVEKLHERGGLGPQVGPDYWHRALQRWIPFQPEALTLLYDELLAEAGVCVRYGARAISAITAKKDQVPASAVLQPGLSAESTRIEALVVADVEGLWLAGGRSFLDATGDAAVASAAGFAVRRAGQDSPRIMPPTLCALFAGIDWNRMAMSPSGNCPDRQQIQLEQALADGHFTRNDRHLPGLYRIAPGLGMMNAGHLFDTDAVDGPSLSRAYAQGRRLVREFLAFYRTYIDGCQDMRLVSTAPLLGVRESRRILGEYELVHADYQRRARFADGIGLCSGSVDIHVYDDSAAEYERYKQEFEHQDRQGLGESFGIPYGILVPKGAENLWVAGRCASTDLKVQGALRIQPAAAVMGQAAGLAVALSLETGRTATQLDIQELRTRLEHAGAILD